MSQIKEQTSLQSKELTTNDVNEIVKKVDSMSYDELIENVSAKTGYKVGRKQQEMNSCGFWNSGVKESLNENDLEEMKLSGRLNDKGEILWFWDKCDMKEILKDILIREKMNMY